MMTGSTSMRPLRGWFPRQRARRLAASLGCSLALLSCAQAASATNAGDDRYISGAAFQEFGWGNGVAWNLSGFHPTWRVSRNAEFGVLAERYVLRDSLDTVTDDRIGITGSFGAVDTFALRFSVVHGGVRGYPDRLDSSIDVVGSQEHFRYEAGYSTGGIDDTAAGKRDLINTRSAGLRIANLRGQLGWASKFTSAYVKGQLSNFSDQNKYHLMEVGATQNLGFIPIDVEVGGYARASGYAIVYPLARAGYYNYAHQNERALIATIRYNLGRHVEASASGAVGLSETRLLAGPYDEQNHQEFEPALTYTNRALELSATGDFAQYLGGRYISDYAANKVDVSLKVRI